MKQTSRRHVPRRLPHTAALGGVRSVGSLGTPRQRELIRVFARVNADNGYDDIELHGDDPVRAGSTWALFHRYPPVTFDALSPWRMIAARSFDDLAADLAAGRNPHPRTTCEQIAMSLIVDDAAQALRNPMMRDDLLDVPHCAADDRWDELLSRLIDRQALARLYRLPGSADRRDAGPEQWLAPFDLWPARDPRRRFRR